MVASEYGLEGSLTPLVSERDQNFRLDARTGAQFVVKIANAAEPAEITDFQVQALLHLEQSGCPVPVPRIVRTTSGEASIHITSNDTRHVLRVVTYLPGEPVEAITPDPGLGYELGCSLARLDRSLQDFSHPGESQVLLWDMQRAGQLRDIIQHVPEADLRDLVTECLDRFEELVLPALPSLRSQVIHNDVNPGNVLVSDGDVRTVAGVIDFGDMLRAPLIIDVAIAASYLREGEALAVIRSFLAGFESVTTLEPVEHKLLYDLVRMRLATTVAILHWRAQARSADDPYLEKALTERGAERFLGQISSLGRDAFEARVLDG